MGVLGRLPIYRQTFRGAHLNITCRCSVQSSLFLAFWNAYFILKGVPLGVPGVLERPIIFRRAFHRRSSSFTQLPGVPAPRLALPSGVPVHRSAGAPLAPTLRAFRPFPPLASPSHCASAFLRTGVPFARQPYRSTVPLVLPLRLPFGRSGPHPRWRSTPIH